MLKSTAAFCFAISAAMGFIALYFGDQMNLAGFTVIGLAAFVGIKVSLFGFMFAKEA